MESLAHWFSPFGRMAPKPFARRVLVVYGAALLSQILMSPPVMLLAGLVPFALVQALASWAWLCLHAKRLRDAGHDIGPALAIAGLYALAIALLLLMVALLPPLADTGQTAEGGAADILVVSRLIAVATGDPALGLFAYVAAGMLALIVTPMVIAIAFSIWAGTRRHALAAAAPS